MKKILFALAVLALPLWAHAAVYQLCTNVAATSIYPQTVAQPLYAGQSGVPQQQAYTFTVTCSGSCSATLQVLGSNDNANFQSGQPMTFVNYGPTVTASGTSSASAAAVGNTPFTFLGVIVTAISGTSAKVSCSMSS